MKKLLVLTVLVLGTSLRAQHPIDIREWNADYPVPTPLAIYSLTELDVPVIEPFTVRNLAVSVRKGWESSTERITGGFEVAPFLIGNNVDLSDYLSGRLMRVLLRTRISLAATTTEFGGARMALGFRWMLHDDADLRSDSLFQRALLSWRVAGDHLPTVVMQERIDSLRQEMKEALWNRSVVELGGAYTTGDEFNNDFYASLSGGFPDFGSSGQLMFGIAMLPSQGRSSSGPPTKFAIRQYVGTSTERAYLEVSDNVEFGLRPDVRLMGGGVLRIANGFWLQAAVGVPFRRYSSGDVRTQAARTFNLTLGFATPEIVR
jgi:hypothetical protein